MNKLKWDHQKTVWQKHGKWFLCILAVFLLSYGGFQYYEYYKTQQVIKASALYDAMLGAVQKQDTVQAHAAAQQLKEQFSRTPYASLAALLLTKFSIEKNDLSAAKEQLYFVINGSVGPIQQIAKVRLARILADEKAYKAALDLLSTGPSLPAYKTLVEETKGDIYLAQNDTEKAREAYQAAIQAAPEGVPIARIQLKQLDLGVVKEGL